MNKKLFIAYYFNEEGEKDAVMFIGKENKKYSDFSKYMKKQCNFDIKKDSRDIDGIYPIETETDKDGNEYLINIIKK